MRKVGILGSAVVGQTLAQGFKQHGYEARIGSRSPAKLAEFTASSGIPAGTFEAVAGWGELLVLAVHGTAATTVAKTRRRFFICYLLNTRTLKESGAEPRAPPGAGSTADRKRLCDFSSSVIVRERACVGRVSTTSYFPPFN